MPIFTSADDLEFTRLTYRSPDPAALTQFHQKALGFPQIPDNADIVGDDADIVRINDSAVLAFEHTGAPYDPHGAGLYHTAFLYPSRGALAQAVRRLVEANIPFQGAADHFVSEAIYLQDPDGNGIEIYCDRPQSEWQYNDSTLVMGTEALDLDDLMAQETATDSSDSRPVRIGHVHLRALVLQDAERFWVDEIGLGVTARYEGVASFLATAGYHHHIGVNRFGQWRPRTSDAPGIAAIELSRESGGANDSTIETTTPEGISVTVRTGPLADPKRH